MENTYSIFIDTLNETWQMPDDLAINLKEFEKNYPAEEISSEIMHLDWYNSLTKEEKEKVEKHKQ